MKKKIMLVFGTRPEAIKMAPVAEALKQYPDELICRVVSTGQHREMLDQVLKIFAITPDHDLNIMEKAQTLYKIVSKSLLGLEEILQKEAPDMLLVQGDTSTAFAAALSAFYAQVPVGHVEAGLRTGDKKRPYPEEANRALISVLADLHFAPTRSSFDNLIKENIKRESIYLTGNSVIDALLTVSGRPFDLSTIGLKLAPDEKTILVTLHRREALGEPMRQVCLALQNISLKFPQYKIVFPVHKNPAVRSVVNGILSSNPNVMLIEPLDYEPFVHLMKRSYLILSDSGGVQEEAPSLGKPVLVLREKTERPEAITAGAVKLIGLDKDKIFAEAESLLNNRQEYEKMANVVNPYGDGKASQRIAAIIRNYFGLTKELPEEFDPKS